MMAGDGSASHFLGWRFLLLFVAIYVALYLGYSAIPDALLRDHLYYYGIVCPSKVLINWLAPEEHAMGQHNGLTSPGVNLLIVRGCDGSGVMFLLIAAIVAYRAAMTRMLLGIAGAVLLIYLLNQIRIVALFFVESHRPSWFMPIHVYLVPTFMVLGAALYFAAWTSRSAPR